MSLARRLAASVREDAYNAATAPARAYDHARYTVEGMRTGEVDPTEVAKTVLITLGALAVVSAMLYPIYYVFIAALQGEGATLYSPGSDLFVPSEPTLEAFLWVIGDIAVSSYEIAVTIPATGYDIVVQTPAIELLDVSDYGVERTSDFPLYLKNSLYVALVTVTVGLALVVPGAYVLSRRQFVGRMKVLYGYVLFTQIGGGLGIAALIALYLIFVNMGWTNSRFMLGLYYAAVAVPFNTWLLKTYMDSIPVSYEEAAIMDGASPARVAWEVVLPLAKPGLATVLIFIFLAGWTEFVIANLMLEQQFQTLPVGLYALIGDYTIPWGRFSAFALCFAFPIVLVYLFAQRYIESGLSFGGMEG
ncbi:sugar ABC transporter permease [Halomontanus rarus]|uniref:sugar ABC transporter permease n=1 Tax=Halomontanus rarus TaxID=3034020 RepID=UPI001F603534|nr:ABC transporter permease subunit [Halovivax sp. TS33]